MKCNYLQYIIGQDEENSPPEVIAWSSDGLKLMEKSVFTCNIKVQQPKNSNTLMFIR